MIEGTPNYAQLAEGQTERETDRETERQTDRETDRSRDRQRERSLSQYQIRLHLCMRLVRCEAHNDHRWIGWSVHRLIGPRSEVPRATSIYLLPSCSHVVHMLWLCLAYIITSSMREKEEQEEAEEDVDRSPTDHQFADCLSLLLLLPNDRHEFYFVWHVYLHLSCSHVIYFSASLLSMSILNKCDQWSVLISCLFLFSDRIFNLISFFWLVAVNVVVAPILPGLGWPACPAFSIWVIFFTSQRSTRQLFMRNKTCFYLKCLNGNSSGISWITSRGSNYCRSLKYLAISCDQLVRLYRCL